MPALRAGDQQPLGVGLGRRDLQERDDFPGRGKPVVDQAVVGEFGQFLDPDASGAQDLDGGERPERVLFLFSQIAALAGGWVLGPDLADG
jgi:hypothetical protein